MKRAELKGAKILGRHMQDHSGLHHATVVARLLADSGLLVRTKGAFLLMVSVIMILVGASTQSRSSAGGTEILGCWRKVMLLPAEGNSKTRGRLIPQLRFCFQKDGTILGIHIESGGHGGDLEKAWRFREPSTLLIDEEPCAIEFDIERRRFTLTDCTYRGEWRFVCHLAEDATQCSAK
jgi:hypothetical protein